MKREVDVKQAGDANKPGVVSHLVATSFSLTVWALFVVYLSFFSAIGS
jgi:hypothetical protein